MLSALIIFVPFVACLFWILIHAMMAPKTGSFWAVALFLLNLAVYLLVDSCYSWAGSSTQLIASFSQAAQFAGPCIIPLLMILIGKLSNRSHSRSIYMIWLIMPAALLTSGLSLYIIVGHDAVAAFIGEYNNSGHLAAKAFKGSPVYYYYLWDILAYNAVIALELLSLAIYMLNKTFKRRFSIKHLWSFLFHGGRIAPMELLFAIVPLGAILLPLKAFVNKPWINSHQGLMMVGAVLEVALVFLFSWIALFSSAELISLREMFNSFRYNYRPGEKKDTAETEQRHIESHTGYIPHRLASDIFASSKVFAEDDSLRARFQHLMQDEHLFLYPSLTLNDVALRLRSNKAYISKMVNTTYNIGFPELLNTLRVDYAQQYILNHRGARQDEIAKACGFLSASSFNNTFKHITGMTPKVWLASFSR